MKKDETEAYRRLEELQDRLERELGTASRGILDLAKVSISPELLEVIRTCIGSDDPLAIGSGFYVLKGILIERSIKDLPDDFLRLLVTRVEELLSHSVESVVLDALDWYGRLYSYCKDYRERMLLFLASEEAGRRRIALHYYQNYTRPREIEPLLRFRNDGYVSEVRPLGDWEYLLRNRALVQIEKQLDQEFQKVVRSEPYEGSRVTWHDWTPFLEWWLKHGSAAAS